MKKLGKKNGKLYTDLRKHYQEQGDAESLQSLNVRGLYPCGEGAGYAGGILSAGIDGIKVAEAVARSLS